MKNLKEILEGLLFVSGDGLERGFIMEKLQVTDKEISNAVETLKEKYSEDSGIHLIVYRDKIQLCSNPQYAEDISVVLNPIREKNLSRSTLETIAIISYKQPVTRLEIEEIRGVNSDYALQTLLKHNLIEVVGRKETLGKPLLFGTTDDFLKRFQIEDLNQLPNYEDLLKQIEVIEQDKDLYNKFVIPEENEESSAGKNTLTLEEENSDIILQTDEQSVDDERGGTSGSEEEISEPSLEELNRLLDEGEEFPEFLTGDTKVRRIE